MSGAPLLDDRLDSRSREADIEECLLGHRLYGDDFSEEELAAWFRDEEEGFSGLYGKDKHSYRYEYHALNMAHGFRYLPVQQFEHAISVGGAYGDELIPLLPKLSRITILEPSNAFFSSSIGGVPVQYVKPDISGLMPFQNGTFDLATCFGCLHHIPNVSRVVGELYRCLAPSGYAVVREPIVSMGDWRLPRAGLTKRERGIPLPCFRRIITTAGFSIRKETLCGFPLIPRFSGFMNEHVYNSPLMVSWDRMLSRLFAENYVYHSSKWLKKLKPTAVSFVLQKVDARTEVVG